MTAVLNVCVMTGMLVVLPLGLRLIEGVPGWVPRAWVAAAGPGALSLWLPRGPVAATLAGLYAVATLVLAGYGVRRGRRLGSGMRGVAVVTALVTPAVAGLALVAERSGFALFGYPLRVLALTVAHFHFAGFAAALATGGPQWMI